MRARNDITFEQVAELLAYDAGTGRLTWRKRVSRRYGAGDIAGSPNSTGHLHVQIKRRKYKAHRLAWLLFTGSWPKHEIDHVNRVRDDNRIANLREAGPGQNCQNASMYKSNSTGFVGVYSRNGRFFSQIKAGGRITRLGTFATANEAALAFSLAKAQLHTFHGEVPRAS